MRRIIAGLSSIPFEKLKKMEFITNLKEATNMGYKIPYVLLSGATRVIR